MDPKWELALFFSLAMGVSFLCSQLEAVLLSVSRGHIESLISAGQRSGNLLKKLKEDIDRPLAAILTLNTVAHTIGAAGVGASAQKIWGDSSLAITSAILTILILIGSEIIPKTLGAAYCKQLAPFTGYTILGLMRILFPVVWCLEKISSWITPDGKHSKISREEVKAVADLGHSEGALQSQENKIIQNILALKNIRVKDILTPRSVVLAFKKDEKIGDVVEKMSPIRFSRIPIYDKDLDDIIGLVNRYKILQAYSDGNGSDTLETIMRNIHPVPDTKTVASTMDDFVKHRNQLFLVVDEYGGTEGIVTLEDVIETLLGVEIVDEYDAVKDMRKLARQLGERRQRQYQREQNENKQNND